MGCISPNQQKLQDRGLSTEKKPQPHLNDTNIVRPIEQSAPLIQQRENAKNPPLQSAKNLTIQQPKQSKQQSPKKQNAPQLIQNNYTPVESKLSQDAINQGQVNKQITKEIKQDNIKKSVAVVHHIIPQQASKEDQSSQINKGAQIERGKSKMNPPQNENNNVSQESQLPVSNPYTPTQGERKRPKPIVKDQPQVEFQALISSQKPFGGMTISQLPKQDNSGIRQGSNNISKVQQYVPSDSKIPQQQKQHKTAIQGQKQPVVQADKRVSKSLLPPPSKLPPSNLPFYSRIGTNGQEIKDNNPNDYVIKVLSVHDEDSMVMPQQQQLVHDQESGAPLQGLLWRSKLAIIS